MAPQPPEVSTTAISVALGNLTLNCSMMPCSVGGAEIFCEIEIFLYNIRVISIMTFELWKILNFDFFF